MVTGRFQCPVVVSPWFHSHCQHFLRQDEAQLAVIRCFFESQIEDLLSELEKAKGLGFLRSGATELFGPHCKFCLLYYPELVMLALILYPVYELEPFHIEEKHQNVHEGDEVVTT